MEYRHPRPGRVSGLSHSDCELWHKFLWQETFTLLSLSTQKYI